MPEVRLVGDNIEMGVYPLQKALQKASELELDLVEISPNAAPPVCKIIDYKKFLYEQKKREKAMKANASKVVPSLNHIETLKKILPSTWCSR